MASIFDGVPFIVRIPGEYHEDSSALNAGLAAGAAAARTSSANRQQAQQNLFEDRKLNLEEKQQEMNSDMLKLRVNGMVMDQDITHKQIMDNNALALWQSGLDADPNKPLPFLNLPASTEKGLDIQAKVQAKKGIIDQKTMVNNYMADINQLAPELRQPFRQRLVQEMPNGISQAFQDDLTEALSETSVTPASFAFAQRKQKEAAAAGDTIGAQAWATKMDDLSNAAQFNKSQMTMTMGPDGVMTVTQGPARAGATGKLAQGEQLNLDLNRSLDDIAFLRRNLRAEDLGVAGWAGEKLDIILPELGVNSTYDKARTTNRERIKLLGIGIGPLLTAEKRFSNEDRQRTEQAMIRSGAIESLPHAQDVLDTLGETLGERNIRLLLEENKGDAYKTRDTIMSGDLRYRNPYTLKAAASDKFRLITPAQARNISVSGNPNDPNPPRPARELQGPPAPGRGY